MCDARASLELFRHKVVYGQFLWPDLGLEAKFAAAGDRRFGLAVRGLQ